MGISYASIEEDEIVLPAKVQANTKVVVQKPGNTKVSGWQELREGTECNILVIFFITSLVYIMMSE